MASPARTLAPALAAGLVLAWAMNACGSGSAAEQVKSAASQATSRTQTVTQPAATATTPPQTVTERSSTVAVVAPTSTTGDGDSGGSGVPWWGWVLIVGGAAGAGVGAYALWRRHHEGGASVA